MKYALVRKGLQQRQEVASKTDGYLHAVAADAVLRKRTKEFHHRAVIARIARNVSGESVQILHDMRLTVLFKLLKDFQLAHIENVVGIGGFVFLRHAKDIIRFARFVGDTVDIRHSSVIEYFPYLIFFQIDRFFPLVKKFGYLPHRRLCDMYHPYTLLTWFLRKI